jgi:tetratricopeptide (TPR) repeat protein
VLYHQHQYDNATILFSKALFLNPSNDFALLGLAWCAFKNMDHTKALDLFNKTHALNRYNVDALIGLGWCHYRKKEYDTAGSFFKKALALAPQNTEVMDGLGWCHLRQHNYADAIGFFKQAWKRTKHDNFALRALSVCYEKKGDPGRSKKYLSLARKALLRKYNNLTYVNYRKLIDTLRKKNIEVICVQYPNRSITPLKKMLAPYQDLILVDNQKIFHDALENGTFADYFTDNFAGDIGHCTPKGNRLLAENIAKTILANIDTDASL